MGGQVKKECYKLTITEYNKNVVNATRKNINSKDGIFVNEEEFENRIKCNGPTLADEMEMIAGSFKLVEKDYSDNSGDDDTP